MKFKFLILFMFLSVSDCLALDAGFLVGAGQSEIDDTDVALVSHESGLRVGVPLKFIVSDVIDLRTGFFYSLRKFQAIAVPPGLEDVEYRLGYLEVPVLGQLNLSEWFAVIAGPVYGFNVSNKAKVDSTGEGIVEGLKKSSFLGQVGISLSFGEFGVDIIYEKGFTDVFSDSDGKWSYVGLNFIYWFTSAEESYGRFSY